MGTIMQNIKVMIIDDEKRTREGLKQAILWEELGAQLSCEAEDGLSALELVRRQQPELILCDIRLPDIDGLEFAEKALEIMPRVKLVFITGYSKPEYMKKAIRMDALDFIEKPVDIAELNAAVRRAVKIIRNEEKMRSSYENLRLKVRLSKTLITAQLFEDLCSVQANPTGIYDKLRASELLLANKAPYRTLVCRTDGALSKTQTRTLCDTAQACMDSLGLSGITGLAQGIYFAAHIRDDDGAMELFIHFYKVLLCESGVDFRAAALGFRVNALGNAASSFTAAKELVDKEYYFGRKRLLIWTPPTQEPLGYIPILAELEQALKDRSGAKSQTVCGQIFTKLETDKELSLQGVWQVVGRILAHLQDCATQNMVFLAELQDVSADVSGLVQQFSGFIAMRGFVTEQLGLLIRGFSSPVQPASLLLEILRYVEANYGEVSLSLKTVAQATYLSPTYISSYFKKSQGQTFQKYLTQLRISKAQKLLLAREYKLYDIAKMVGFQNENYFCKVFKKELGMSPIRYRESGRESYEP